MRRITLAIAVGALTALAAVGTAAAHTPIRNDDDTRAPIKGAAVREVGGDVTADLIGSVPLGGTATGGTAGDFADVRVR